MLHYLVWTTKRKQQLIVLRQLYKSLTSLIHDVWVCGQYFSQPWCISYSFVIVITLKYKACVCLCMFPPCNGIHSQWVTETCTHRMANGYNLCAHDLVCQGVSSCAQLLDFEIALKCLSVGLLFITSATPGCSSCEMMIIRISSHAHTPGFSTTDSPEWYTDESTKLLND